MSGGAMEPINGYRVLEELGRGTFGVVWKGEDARTGKKVAIKVVHLSAGAGLSEVQSLELVKHFNHPHVLQVFAVALRTQDGREHGLDFAANPDARKLGLRELVVVMELASETLADRLDRLNAGRPADEWRGLPPGELLTFMADAANGLDFLNAKDHGLDPADGLADRRIIHCDIKPANLLIVKAGRDEVVKVADSGIGVTEDERKSRVRFCEPVAPPELQAKNPHKNSDQYSLAVTYHELRTGKLPFDPDATADNMMRAIGSGELAFDTGTLTPAEVAVLRKATDKQPDQRYASCAELVEELRRAVPADRLPPSPADSGVFLPPAPPGRVVSFSVRDEETPPGRAAAPSPPADGLLETVFPSQELDAAPFRRPVPAPPAAKRRSAPQAELPTWSAPAGRARSAAPVARRATVRFYSRMAPQRSFPLLVVLAPGEIAEVVKKHVEQAVSQGFAADPAAPVEVEPVLPGCGVYPPTDKIDVTGSEPKTLTFYVVPQLLGPVLGARVLVRQGGRVLAEIPLKIRVRRTTAAWVLAGFGLAAPHLMTAAKPAGLDWEAQKAAGFPVVQTALQVGADLLRPEWLGPALLALAAGVWLYLRPRQREVFWDVNPKG